jgi:2,3-bisphosphoglycerate-independent phosphoglycerate mutase
MASTALYSIAVEQDDIVVRLNRAAVDQEALRRFLDYIELESLRARSQLTPEDAADLANEIDRAAWEQVRPGFVQE